MGNDQNHLHSDFVWDGDDLVYEYVRNMYYYPPLDNCIVYNYGNGMISQSNTETNEYILFTKNTHGDVSDMLNAASTDLAVFAEKEFDAFGNGGTTQYSAMGYAGQYHDYETGFVYLRARYYSPAVGRFINEDPIRDGLNWYVYANSNPINFIDPSGLDAVVITADNAAESSGVYFGHTSVIVQDDNGDWYYYYWGDEAAYFIEVPDDIMGSLESFNSWIAEKVDGGELKNSTKNYTAATYIEGDFSASYDYFSNLVKNADVGTKREFAGPGAGYVTKSGNFDYSLFFRNCLTTSIEGLHKGTLSNGKSYVEAFPYKSIIPKSYKTKVRDAFGNNSFVGVKS